MSFKDGSSDDEGERGYSIYHCQWGISCNTNHPRFHAQESAKGILPLRSWEHEVLHLGILVSLNALSNSKLPHRRNCSLIRMLTLLVIQIQSINFSMTFSSPLEPRTWHCSLSILSIALSSLQQQPHLTWSTQFAAKFYSLPARSHFSQGS